MLIWQSMFEGIVLCEDLLYGNSYRAPAAHAFHVGSVFGRMQGSGIAPIVDKVW